MLPADAASNSEWPELVGLDVDVAQACLESATKLNIPQLQFFQVQMGSMVTMDYRMDRVRIYYDPVSRLVAKTPRVG